MGVPAFYRWLVERYPRSVVDVVEEAPVTVNGACMPPDTSKPNPNGVEFDNLYLDMNGIIHPCFHPEGLPAPKAYDDVFSGVFKYIDRIFAMIRPRKLLYLAIDGVAPSAKMNQQRARRFKAAKEAAEEASKGDSLTGDNMTGRGGKVAKLDSNVITPGTEFMEILSSALRYYIHLKMNSDPGWQGIKVILSDANVPGEGEHKIMSYIRLQRHLHRYDANTRHCLYGLDADLIMLALATHEVHFSVLREDVHKEPQKSKVSKGSDYSSHLNMLHEGTKSSQGEEYIMYLEDYILKKRFQFLNIWVLREYLGFELRIPDPPVQVNLERLIDDFVFMCLFVGNDFLPHVPSLETSEGAIDLLMMVYKTEFKRMGGYLTKSSEVYLSRVEHFVQAIGAYENGIFKKRNEERKEWEKHLQRRLATSMDHVYSEAPVSVDKVKLGEDGWKERHYCEKFKVQGGDACERIKRNTVLKYVEGICWVMHYYYQGVCSWNWFYPYHYAPFASDFQGLRQLQIDFLLGKPLKPLDQLMSVLPASSAQALPLSYRKLMTDPSSPILDFYPSDFELDMNGKRHAWQAVCKLPFIEELRLLSEIEKVEHTLTDDEKRRNRLGLDQLFLHSSHRLATKILKFCKCHGKNPEIHLLELKRKIEPELSDGMNGYISISDKPVCPVEIFSPIDGMELIKNNKVISTFYKLPQFHPHISKLSEGVIFPEKSVSEHDVELSPILWHEKTGFLRSRIAQRRIPLQAISGSCLKKLAHQLVLQNVLVKRKGKNADGYMKNNSEVSRSEENCLMVQKVMHVDGASEKNSEVRKKEQTCLVEPKDNNVDGSGESKSEIRKRKGVPNKIEKKKKRKKENKNNTDNHAKESDEVKYQNRKREADGPDKIEKENRNNPDWGTENNSEYRAREQNCQADQNDFDVDGESEKNAEVRQREQIIIVKEKGSNVDGSGKNKSKMRERGDVPEEIKEKKKKKRKENRNCQVDQKEFSVDRESENSSAGRQKEQNFIVERKDNNADSGSEKNLEFVEDQKDRYADIGTEKNSKVRKKEQNCQQKQKDGNLNVSGLNECQIRKEEGDMPDKIEKKKKKNGNRADKGAENNFDQGKREQNCHVDQEDCNFDRESKSNSDTRGREQNFIVAQKHSNEDGNIEKDSLVWRRECDTLYVKITKKNRNDVNEGTETNFEVKRRELNCLQKDSNADGECKIFSVVGNGEQNCQPEQNDSTVDENSQRNPKARKRVRDMVDDRIASKKKKTMNNVYNGAENNSEVKTREQNCREDHQKERNGKGEIEYIPEVMKREQNYLMEKIDSDDMIAKKKNKKRKLKNGASKASTPPEA